MTIADLTAALRQARTSDESARLEQAFHVLNRDRMLATAFVRRATEPEQGVPSMFDTLVALGRGDLSIARLFEGHANAVQLVARLGSHEQKEAAFRVADSGKLMGVWGADDPTNPARLDDDTLQLTGRKTFASGADSVALAVVAAKTRQGTNQLLLIDAKRLEGRFDAAWWRASGMKATRSFAVDLNALPISESDLLGSPGAYERQPFFGAGAIRFVTAQLGGALAVWDAMRMHLSKTGRADDPHQAARLASVVADLEAAFCFVKEAYARVAPAIAWSEAATNASDGPLIADAARIVLEETVDRVLPRAMRSVGCAGLMETHPLHLAMSDLMVYVRQPAPDMARVRLGTAAAGDSYKAAFDAA